MPVISVHILLFLEHVINFQFHVLVHGVSLICYDCFHLSKACTFFRPMQTVIFSVISSLSCLQGSINPSFFCIFLTAIKIKVLDFFIFSTALHSKGKNHTMTDRGYPILNWTDLVLIYVTNRETNFKNNPYLYKMYKPHPTDCFVSYC